MRELAVAGIRFAMKSSHADGSCDDYFPFEQAMGALVFSTYACTEAYQLLGLHDDEITAFFHKRGTHLAKHNETGQLANHQAFAALAAYNIFLVTGDKVFRDVAEERAKLTLSWQNKNEGWFQEYEGADPGYHTCTIDFLAKLWQKSGWEFLQAPLVKAVDFAWHFMHPDGSYGGEYGSRNTYHFYPHGFELMAPHTEKAAQINDAFLRGLSSDKRYHNDDDRMCSHTVYDWLQAYDDYYVDRPADINTRPKFTKWMPGCETVAVNADNYYAVANLRKGGVIKVFTEQGCIGSDTGLIAELDSGETIVSHLMDEANSVSVDIDTSTFSVEGSLAYRQSKLSSPMRMIIFRAVNMTAGRFFPNLLRLLVQKLLITGKRRSKYGFKRTISFQEDCITITDELPAAVPIRRMSAGSDATSIYVANSNVYQESVIRIPWQHAGPELVEEVRREGGSWTREITGGK
jgi:hypothetical protein